MAGAGSFCQSMGQRISAMLGQATERREANGAMEMGLILLRRIWCPHPLKKEVLELGS